MSDPRNIWTRKQAADAGILVCVPPRVLLRAISSRAVVIHGVINERQSADSPSLTRGCSADPGVGPEGSDLAGPGVGREGSTTTDPGVGHFHPGIEDLFIHGQKACTSRVVPGWTAAEPGQVEERSTQGVWACR